MTGLSMDLLMAYRGINSRSIELDIRKYLSIFREQTAKIVKKGLTFSVG